MVNPKKAKTIRACRNRRSENRRKAIGSQRSLLIEALEDRRVLHALLFVDFGDNFPSGTLATTQGGFRDVANDPTPANRVLGTTLTDSNNNFNAGTALNIVAQTFTTTERAQMMAVVRRDYLPLDIEVIELTASAQMTSDGRSVAAATSMADVVTTLRGGAAGSRDAYIFVATFIVDPGGANQKIYGNNGGGNSPGGGLDTSDLSAASNVHDDVAAVFSNGGLSNNTLNNIAHEAGHCFGLQHAITNATGTNATDLYHQAELMSYRNTNNTTSSMFARMPMTRGDNNSPGFNGSATFNAAARTITQPAMPSNPFDSAGFVAGLSIVVSGTASNNGTYVIQSVNATVITLTTAATLTDETSANTSILSLNTVNYNDLEARNGQNSTYDQLRNDGNIGANPNFDFISGSGANDIITIVKNGGNADVTIQPFVDAAFATPITIPGFGSTSYTYSFPLSRSILVYAGDSSDRIVVDVDLGVDVQIDGMLGIDSLIVEGKGAANVTYTPDATSPAGVDILGATNVTSFGGSVLFGGKSITFNDFETTSTVTLLDFGTVTYATPLAGADLLNVSSPSGGDPQVAGLVNGGTSVVPVVLQTVTSLSVQTGDGSDTLTIKNAGNLVKFDIQYDGGISAGDSDKLAVTGNPGSPIARETYLVGATQDAGIWVLDADGNMGPGAAGAANGDELVVDFKNLEPVDSDVPAAVFDVILSASADNATIGSGGFLNGLNSLQVTDHNGTFETFRVAQKTIVRIMGQSDADTITADYTSADSSLTTLEIYGHVAPDVVGQAADDNAVDQLSALATAVGVGITLFGQGGDDSFTVGDGDLSQILAAVAIDAGDGLGDSLVVDDSGRNDEVDYVIDPTFVALDTGIVANVATFTATLESARINGTQGVNEFHVTPSADTEFFIDGNDPSTPPGDYLEINFAGTTGRHLTKIGSSGMWEFSNREDVKFEDIERFNFFPIITVGADAGAHSRSSVHVYDAELGDLVVKFFAYGTSFKGGVRVAVGDINADGIPEIVTAPGPGRSSLVKVFDILTGTEILGDRIRAYESSFRNGIYVATGDITADGVADIITSPGPGRDVHIRVWKNETAANPADPFADLQWLGFRAFGGKIRSGATVAAGDLTGDGRAEIVVGSGPGIAPRIRVYDISTIDPLPTPGYVDLLPFIYQIRPFNTSDRGGVFVAVGNVRGDGIAEIIAGSGVGGRGRVEMYNSNGTRFKSFSAYPNNGNNSAVHVAVENVDADAFGEIITGEGPGGSLRRRAFDADATMVDDILEIDPDFRDGFFVA
ncbi:MAG: hypothetical protein IT427_02090 [Pirellulales bacterium]|nr:hypothetical protein [Pirellulales bacterium]